MLKRKYDNYGILLYGQAPSVNLVFLEDRMGGTRARDPKGG